MASSHKKGDFRLASGRLGRVTVPAASAAPGDIIPADAAANPANPAPSTRRSSLRDGEDVGVLVSMIPLSSTQNFVCDAGYPSHRVPY